MTGDTTECPLGERLSRIDWIAVSDLPKDQGYYDEVRFVFCNNQSLECRASPVTDEVEVSVRVLDEGPDTSLMNNAQPAEGWVSQLVGSELVCVWTTSNSRGYRDLILLAFGRWHPSIAVLCEASALRVFRIGA